MISTNAVILNTRSLLHLEIDKEGASSFLITDKLTSYFIFFAYWIDAFLIISALQKKENHGSTNDRRFENTEEEKKQLKMYKEQDNNKENQVDS